MDLVNYQNKCKLIRGWDDLFTKCREHMNSVAAMKLSPYYKVISIVCVCVCVCMCTCVLYQWSLMCNDNQGKQCMHNTTI